jgi:diguanylate cyclase (GGDEF)-like protein/PAS domain S-box-containing protein
VCRSASPIRKRHEAAWRRRFAFPIRLTGSYLFVSAATIFVGLAPQANLIWVANGLSLGYLLLVPRRRWPAYLAAGLAGQMTGAMLVNHDWRMNLLNSVLNLAEVLIGALLLRRRDNDLPRFTDRAYLLRFIGCAVLAAPAIAGLVFALTQSLMVHKAPWRSFVEWVVADGLGAGVATPAFVAVLHTRFRDTVNWKRHWVYPFLAAAVTVAAFSQTKAPFLFLIYPFLIPVLLKLRLGWAALVTLFVAWVGSWYTLHGAGPFSQFHALSPLEPSVVMQVFIAAAMFMLYCVSVVLESHADIERRLRKIAMLHKMVTENSRDIILLAGFDGVPHYISPAVETLTGWRADETMRRGFAEVAHPEDLPKLEAAVGDLRSGAEGIVIEYRVRKRSGGYVWVEGNLRAIRDPVTGVRSGILQIVRDISERKRADLELQAAYRAVEALSVVDELTCIANRRRFDQCLTTEWRRGLRDRQPLSLLLIDADLFKSFNDTYGHVCGDGCLKQIAEAALDVVYRPGDLVARYGGEEFAVILPNTPHEGALQIADEICESLRRRKLAHSSNPRGIVTISIGCATLVPALGQLEAVLVEMADAALYRAKQNGRDRVCDGNAMGRLEFGTEESGALTGAGFRSA